MTESPLQTPDQFSDEDLAKEYVRREQAKRNFLHFVDYTMPNFQVGPHHPLIAKKLELVARGTIRRLIITCPPRHTKSELASRRLPAWFLGHAPRKQVICATYNDEFATEFGRDVRGIVQSDEYQAVFPLVKISKDSKAANRWNTSVGGSYYSVGIGGGVTGRGADLAIIDDPVKNMEEADSKHYRDRVGTWYKSAFYTRLMPKASIILILTRWSDDDLAGRLLAEAKIGGDKWEVISLQAIAGEEDLLGRKKGEALWPQWYPEPVLQQIKRTLGPRAWSALYQQEPVEDEGQFFKREWIDRNTYDKGALLKRVHDGTKHLKVYGASDYAVTPGGGDYTVHLVVGVDNRDDIYVLDMWRDQTESAEWVEAFCDLVLRWKPVMWAEESGQIIKGVGPYLSKRMRERRAYCRREQFASAHDKATRARPIQARMSMNKVFFPETASWMDEFVHEMLRFPAGVHDDQVDTLSLIGRVLDQMSTASDYKEPPSEEFTPTTWGDIWKRSVSKKKGQRPRRSREAPVIAPPQPTLEFPL